MSVTLVLVNGPHDCLMGRRARALFSAAAEILYKEQGRFGSLTAIASGLRRHGSGIVYCIDMGFPAAPLAAARRLVSAGIELVYEIGDPAGLLLQMQRRPFLEVWVAAQLDRWLPAIADKIVFRGSYLIDHFRRWVAARLSSMRSGFPTASIATCSTPAGRTPGSPRCGGLIVSRGASW